MRPFTAPQPFLLGDDRWAHAPEPRALSVCKFWPIKAILTLIMIVVAIGFWLSGADA